jgi:transposase
VGCDQADVAEQATRVPGVNDRRVLNGIFWVVRSSAPWRDLPQGFGPYTTCYNRFVTRHQAKAMATMNTPTGTARLRSARRRRCLSAHSVVQIETIVLEHMRVGVV